MKDSFIIIELLVIIVFIFVLAIGMGACDESKWNNGYCQCGGRWEYEQAVGHRHSTSYIYICDKCGAREEFDKIRQGGHQ